MFESRIAKLMNKQGKTIQDLVKITNIPRTTLLRFIKNTDLGKVSLSTPIKISMALNCKVEDLFVKKDQRENFSTLDVF